MFTPSRLTAVEDRTAFSPDVDPYGSLAKLASSCSRQRGQLLSRLCQPAVCSQLLFCWYIHIRQYPGCTHVVSLQRHRSSQIHGQHFPYQDLSVHGVCFKVSYTYGEPIYNGEYLLCRSPLLITFYAASHSGRCGRVVDPTDQLSILSLFSQHSPFCISIPMHIHDSTISTILPLHH